MTKIKVMAAGMLACGLIASALGASFLISGEAGTKPEKNAQDYMREGDLHLGNGEYYRALVSYEDALAREKSVEALDSMAAAYSRISDYENEELVRRQIEEIEPDNLDNQIRLIEIMIQQEKLQEAKSFTEELLQKHEHEELNALYQEMNIEAPAFNLVSGSFDDYQLLQLTNPHNNANVYYTTDGSNPGKGSAVYQDEIVISYPETVIRAKAIGYLGYESEEIQLNFTITKPAQVVPKDSGSTIYYIGNRLFNKSWNEDIYNYELAQIREIYLVGDYNVSPEPESMVFYEDFYVEHDRRQDQRGNFTLEFARYTPFLKTLSIGYQERLDISPLIGLSYLENLSLLSNKITDISPLEGLVSLKKLALGWNNITDASPLESLINLESLGLWDNQISDVDMLGGLTELTYFDVSNNYISQIECTRTMPKLNEIWINNNQIQTLEPLDHCEKLMVLMQGNNPISDYGTIKERADQFYKSDLKW